MTVRTQRSQVMIANGWITLIVIAYVAIRLAGSAKVQALVARLAG